MPPVSAPSRRRAAVAPLDPLRFRPTRERPVRAKLRRLAPDTQIQPHSHAWAQVAISIAGVARITAGRHTYLVPGWRAVWIPPGVEHVVTALEAAELRTLYIHQEPDRPGPAVARRDCEPWRGCRVLEVSPLLRELVLDELRRAAPLRLGIELPQDRRLRSLCEAVLQDPSRHATLEGWAHETAASPRTVARLFRQQLDTSFGPWRQQVLLAHALRLAAQGRPMGLIAAELGYSSPSAFSAMVRRAVGQPPSRFFALR